MDSKKRRRRSPQAATSQKMMRVESKSSERITAIQYLRSLLYNQTLIFLEGSSGCGKTNLVKKLAEEVNLPLQIIQLNDQNDSRVLMGTYHCTEVPGEFVWMPSNFAKCLSTRSLILLEDLDCATPDLIAMLLKLAEDKYYFVTSIKEFVNPECRIIATLQDTRRNPNSSSLIDCYHITVNLPPFTNAEIEDILYETFPDLNKIQSKLMEIFQILQNEILNFPLTERRLISTDFFRACARLNQLVYINDHIPVFNELNDLWVMAITNQELRKLVGLKLASLLTITPDQYNYVINVRKPEIVIEDKVKIGRISLSKVQQKTFHKLSTFGLTREVCQLLERIAMCVCRNESVLLTGETGVGKTSVIQLLASYVNANLRVVNMSQDSDTTDLIGGYKPVSIVTIIQPLLDDYELLFDQTFERTKNTKFFAHLNTCLTSGRFADFLKLLIETATKALELPKANRFSWTKIIVRAKKILHSLSSRKSALPFAYIRGIVSEAAELGHWLLIDEINLASPDCLEAVVRAIGGSLHCHPNFRLFASMNPPTDAGKRQLSSNIRSRFTEFFVSETIDPEQLAIIIKNYSPAITVQRLNSLLNFYIEAKTLMPRKYSLRNLCRALLFGNDNPYGNEMRSLYEGIVIAFTSELEQESSLKFSKILRNYFKEVPSGFARPSNDHDYIEVQGSYIEKGPKSIEHDPDYIYTESVIANLAHVSRVVANGRFPILLEGETSAGKTSLILHLAKITGNNIHRINNHEYTDMQEYIGSYAPDLYGRLTFVEGVLLKAVRNGDWVILDELNLAPVEVLEALNRLLDDNHELYVSELNSVVKAHSRFRLFATQNPVGSYAGRKRLSRAFLNRFVVFRFQHPPFSELEEIVAARCGVSPSASKLMVEIMTQLKNSRSITGIFSASDALITLRDLFRWGSRIATSLVEDWRQSLADQGYFLLAGRCRNSNDHDQIVEILEKISKRIIDSKQLFSLDSHYFPSKLKDLEASSDIVLTFPMRRMLVLCAEAWRCNEAVLFVGETGCGKTTTVQLISEDNLLSINCHERTDTSDFLGSIRPREDGTFFWQDGVVIHAMRTGAKLLIDEISLAIDSVLERLNPLLEPSRTILLTDVGAEAENVCAQKEFQLAATMNPGNDYGKKELSKALRNRFTEIWCTTDFTFEDLVRIIYKKLSPVMHDNLDFCQKISQIIVEYLSYYLKITTHLIRSTISIRDMIFASELFKALYLKRKWNLVDAIVHSTYGYIVPLLESSTVKVLIDIAQTKNELAIMCAKVLLKYEIAIDVEILLKKMNLGHNIQLLGNCLSIDGLLEIPYGKTKIKHPSYFSFDAPACQRNTFLVVRALAIEKPILLEGSPGSGKSSLIMALAQSTGHVLTRLNLSEYTDLSDLFGSDVPIVLENGSISFTWRDGPILKAMKKGRWILLDEMNLASQSVLEGLNACFDFRRELFIPALNKTFKIDNPNMRFFACQNPTNQGGNRRALPKSFLNRFSIIPVQEMSAFDYEYVLNHNFGKKIDSDLIKRMIKLNEQMIDLVKNEHVGGLEFNLRDLIRWAELTILFKNIAFGFELFYISRFDSDEMRRKTRLIFEDIMKIKSHVPIPNINALDRSSKICLTVGPIELETNTKETTNKNGIKLLSSQAILLQSLATCLKMDWLALLVGPANVGKRSAIECLANLCGTEVKSFRLTSETDTLDLIGSYEQVLDSIQLSDVKNSFHQLTRKYCKEISKEVVSAMDECDNILNAKAIIEQAILLTEKNELKNELEIFYGTIYAGSIKFEWKNSDFVEAYQNGYWIIFEDVNCCSSAVLDRLNSTLENHGKLILSEHIGNHYATNPLPRHKNFRVFFTMDPKNGSLSRAMRNRSVEIFVGFNDTWSNLTNDAFNVIFDKNFPAINSKYNIVEKCSPKSLLKIASMNEQQLSKLDQLKEVYANESKSNIDNLDERTFNTFIRAPEALTSQGIQLFEQSLLLWKSNIWSAVSQNSIDPTASLLMYCCSTILPQEFNLNNLFEKFWSIQKLNNKNFCMHKDFFLTRLSSPEQQDFGELTQKTNSFVHSLFLNWLLSRIKSGPCMAGSVLQIGQQFDKKEITISELPSTDVLSLYKFFTNFKVALSSLFNLTDKTSIINALKFLFTYLVFHTLAGERITDRLGTVPLQMSFAHLLSTIYFPLNIKSILSTPITTLQFLFQTANLANSEKFERILADHAICYPLTNEEEAGLIKNFSIDSQRDQNCECEKIFELAVLSINDLLLAFSFTTTNLPFKCYNFLPQPFSLNAITRFSFKELETKKNVETLFFLSTNCAVKYFKPCSRNIDLFYYPFVLEVMTNLWRPFNFMNNFYQIKLKEASDAKLRLQDYQMALWILLKNESNTVSNFDSQLAKIYKLTMDNNLLQEDHAILFIGRLSELLRLLTPPAGFIDPIIKDEIRQTYAQRSLRIIEELIEPLQKYLLLTTANWECYYLENSMHPLIYTIFQLKTIFLQELESLNMNEQFYRPNYAKFGSLCVELKSFTEMTIQWIAESMDDFKFMRLELRDLSLQEIKLYIAQIETFFSTFDSFVKHMLSEFCEFPDILMPYLIVVHSLIIVLSSNLQKMRRYIKTANVQSYFKIHQKINFNEEISNVLSNDAILKIVLCKDSPMPVNLQAYVVQFLVSNDKSKMVLNWLSTKWRFWYEQNSEKREKLFVYKQAGGSLEDQEEMIDEDKIEAQHFLTDYSSTTFEDDFHVPKIEDLDAEQIYKPLNIMSGAFSVQSSLEVLVEVFSPMMWIMDKFVGTDSNLDNDFLLELKDFQLMKVNQCISKFSSDQHKIEDSFNVYFANDPSLTLNCLLALEKVERKINELLVEFSENAILQNILEVVLKFKAFSFETPQLHLAALLEKILEEVEHWEKVADKSRSLNAEVQELRYILVEWRKLEVVYWSQILERVYYDSEQLTFLTSWPLFESLQTITTDQQAQNLLAAFIEWINASTLMDFKARLTSGFLLAKWAELLNMNWKLAERVRSIIHYFSQYSNVINEQFKKDKDEIEIQLKDFIKIVKYQDLNLWSVKQSVKKAHKQIAKLIKNFKSNGNKLAASYFDNWAPKFPELFDMISIEPHFFNDSQLATKINGVNNLINLMLNDIPNYNCFENLSFKCSDFLNMLKLEVKYDGEDEESNKKKQGRALGDRRKRFFQLIKESSACGLSSRRGQSLKDEELTMNSLFVEPPTLIPKASKIHNLLLQCSLMRNLIKRYVSKLNSQQSPQVTSQVPVLLLDHIKGISDFGLYWLFNASKSIEEYLNSWQFLFLFRDAFEILIKNHKQHSEINHALLAKNREKSLEIVRKIKIMTSRIMEVIKSAPNDLNQQFNSNYPGLNCEILYKKRGDYESFVKASESCLDLINAIENEILYDMKPLYISNKDHSVVIWKSDQANNFVNRLKEFIDKFRVLVENSLSEEFPQHIKILLNLLESLYSLTIDSTNKPSQKLDLVGFSDDVLLKIQSIFTAFKSTISPTEPKSIDHIKRLIEKMHAIDLSKIIERMFCIVIKLSSESRATADNLTLNRDALRGICETVNLISHHFSMFLESFSIYFLYFEHAAFHIVKNGFVNPIPKIDKSTTEENRGEMNEDISGMGEGQGTADVSNQIDEIGQLEGLQNESNNQADEEQIDSMKDVEMPIDVEDDFAANLENLDENNSENENENEGNENSDENIDWNIGDVEEPVQNQLDPSLWDKNKEDPVENFDENDESAQNRNDELAAKEKSSTLPNDNESVDDQNEEMKQDEEAEDKNEPNNQAEEEQIDSMKDTEMPIDVEDDFAANLENLDENNSENENEDEGNENSDENIERNVGDVEESVQNQLDPSMQDENKEDPVENLNENGAQNRNNESAAKENDESAQNRNDELAAKENDESAQNRNDELAAKKGSSTLPNDNESVDDQNEEKKHDEEAEDKLSYEKPPKKVLEDEELPAADDENKMDEDIQGEETDKYTGDLAHVINDEMNPYDRHVIQKASIEEAILSRKQFDKIVDSQLIERKISNKAKREKEIIPRSLGFEQISDVEHDKEIIINTSFSLYDLVKSETVDARQLEDTLQDMNISNNDYIALQTKWSKIADVVSVLSSELAENLRIIIEPSVATKLQGDYRSGKRLNMRRLIAYIASDYRKDRIWMRRTKKSQRNYQICIAVDDSASMKENFMSEITCQSVCLIEKALRQLEIGEVSICKFGKTVTFLNEFHTQSVIDIGPRLLQELSFEQDKTDLINLLNVVGNRFMIARQGSRPTNQMLIIIGDGRGMLSDSLEKITDSIRMLVEERIIVFFIIVDSGKKSIVDTTIAEFSNGQVNLIPYMSKFPFPFYALIRNINVLPATCAEALRQWFELTIRD